MKTKKPKERKQRNLHAVSAHFRSGAGAMKSKKQNLLEEQEKAEAEELEWLRKMTRLEDEAYEETKLRETGFTRYVEEQKKNPEFKKAYDEAKKEIAEKDSGMTVLEIKDGKPVRTPVPKTEFTEQLSKEIEQLYNNKKKGKKNDK